MKRVYFLPAGQYTESSGNTLCCDSDHNGRNELIFFTLYPRRWEVWEYRPINRYELVFADTGAYPYPVGITTGNFRPFDVGDIDQDGLTDLVGPNEEGAQNPDTFYNVVTTQESPNYFYYPESLSWWYRYANNMAASQPYYFTLDLDRDGRNEIISATPTSEIATGIWENVANNQNSLVWHRAVGAFSFAFNDFDLDNRREFATANLGSLGRVSVYENVGDNQYEMIYQDTVRLPNGHDVFSGNDLDGDGKPEFFVGFYVAPRLTFYLYMWEATGNNTYERIFVDQVTVRRESYSRSKCGDIDGDGIENLVWSVGDQVSVYKTLGNNQFQRVWTWLNPHGAQFPTAIVNIYDMNKNGYKEIVIGGDGCTELWEVEAVKVLRPNGGESFVGGSQELIRWQTFYPPRCDSLSLFFSPDNGRNYEVIATGIPGNDTSYLWTVPNISSDSCKIKIIAYGPGWQYDESDGLFSITPTGIEERQILTPRQFNLIIQPNLIRNFANVKFSLSEETNIKLQISDISGKIVKTLIQGTKKPGNYNIRWNGNDNSNKRLPSGIYFFILDTPKKKMIKKALILK